MPSNVSERFRSWCAREESGAPLLLFRRVFVAIWLLYDVLDVATTGTASGAWLLPEGQDYLLRLLQYALIAAQAFLLVGVLPEQLALLCAMLRFTEAWFCLSLNDFYYYSVVMLILSQVAIRKDGRTLAWPRDVLVLQAAWIYFATGLLKVNPEWLSGGHLFVRIQYLAGVYNWPFPEAFRAWTAVLAHDAWLAYAGVAGELLLAMLLVVRAPRRVPIGLAIAIHGFAALTANVWFWGAAMIAQVSLARNRAKR